MSADITLLIESILETLIDYSWLFPQLSICHIRNANRKYVL
jgi:hypothetical protein